jgi:HlyD family secretion protein
MIAPKRRRRWWILGVVLLVPLGLLALYLSNGKKPVSVKILRPKYGRVESSVTANSVGTVEAEKVSTVSAEISGKVVQIAVRPSAREGSLVSVNTVVVSIDASDIHAEWTVTNLDLQTQKVRKEQAVLRSKKLQSDYDRLRDTDEPKQNLERLEKEIEIAQKDEEIAESALKTLAAQLNVIELRKAQTEVKAPFEGTLSKLFVEMGEMVIPGKPLFMILSNGPLLIRAPIDEVDKPAIHLDDEVRVSFDGYASKFLGTIHEIMSTASTDQKNNRTIDIKVKTSDMPAEICAGMSAHVEIIVAKKERGLFIPTHLVHEERGGEGISKFVYLVLEKTARKRTVKTGLMNWETTEIIEGLTENDAVVNPLNLMEDQVLTEGTKVEVVP